MALDAKKSSADPELQNEGEGSRTATGRYDAGADKAARDAAHVKRSGQEAQKALEGPKGKDLQAAEARGKKHDHR
jgi:hypothetical protein